MNMDDVYRDPLVQDLSRLLAQSGYPTQSLTVDNDTGEVDLIAYGTLGSVSAHGGSILRALEIALGKVPEES